MKDQMKKYLLCGGILLALGAVSAGLLAGVNLITAPIIAEETVKKAKEGYLKVFEEAKSFSDQMDFSSDTDKKALSEAKLTPTNVDYYVIAYGDEAKKEEIGKVFHGAIQGRDATLELLVGFTSKNGETALKKISMLKCTDSYKATFEKNYLDPVNSGKRSYDDLKNVGATTTSTAVSTVVKEASNLFAALGGGIVEDPSAWNKAAFADKSYKVSTSAETVEGSSTFTRYYSYYDDELAHNEIGRWYIAKEGDFAAAIAVSTSGFEGGYVLSSSYTDVDYKNSPYFSSTALTSGNTGVALSSLGAKARELTSSSPFQTIAYQAVSLYEGGEDANVTPLNIEIQGVENQGEDDQPWPSSTKRQIIANSYAVIDKDGAELGVVYEAEFHLSLGEEEDRLQAHGGLYFLLGFSGESLDNPTLTKIVALENSFSRSAQFENKVIAAFNNGEDHSWKSFKDICQAEAEANVAKPKTGATVSSHGLYAVAELERKQYVALKGGK